MYVKSASCTVWVEIHLLFIKFIYAISFPSKTVQHLPQHMFPVFLLNIKLEQLQFTVLNQSRDFSKFFNINKFLLLSCKCIFKDFLNSSLLWLMIHFTCIFVEYQTAAIADHSFKQSGDLSKTVISWKENFPCYRPNVSQSSCKMFLRMRTYDTRCLNICWMSNLRNRRSLFWSDHGILVKLSKLVKLISTAIFQIYFQSFSEKVFKCIRGEILVGLKFQSEVNFFRSHVM